MKKLILGILMVFCFLAGFKANAEVIEGTKENFVEKFMLETKPTVLYFYTKECTYCVVATPMTEDVAKKMNNVVFIKINAKEERELSKGLRLVPTFMIFSKGASNQKKFKGGKVGIFNNSDEMIEFIKDKLGISTAEN